MGAPETLDGWYVYHEFRAVDWHAFQLLDGVAKQSLLREWRLFTSKYRLIQDSRKGSFGQFVIAGNKADLMIIHMRPTIDELNMLKSQMEKTKLFQLSASVYSYISVVELGSYLAKSGVDIETDDYIQSRLKPTMPPHSHVSFYPMNKRREGNDNWYMLSAGDRRDFLKDHGMIGRQYAGKVKQIISGSVGLDDWEWGVTLFSDDPLQFKKLVYEMRFDESSARFAEFGPFYVGVQVDDDGLHKWLCASVDKSD